MGTPYLSEVKIIAWNFSPKGWAFCNGQFLPINQNQALFSLLGTMYGGNGQTTFALPDMRGRVAVHIGSGYIEGQAGGQTAHTVTLSEMAAHNHMVSVDATTAPDNNTGTPGANTVFGQSIGVPGQGASFPVSMYGGGNPGASLAPQSMGPIGGSQPHNNMQPYLVLNFIIALTGVFPSRN